MHYRKLQYRFLSVLLLFVIFSNLTGFANSADSAEQKQAAPVFRTERFERLQETPYIIKTSDISAETHIRRMVELETDLSTIIYKNEDGSRTAYIFSQPVKYVDEDGFVKDKDLRLTALSANHAFQYQVADNDVKTFFPKTFGLRGVQLAYQDLCIALQPYANHLAKQKALQTKAAQLQTSGAKETVVYRKASGMDTDISYIPTLQGLKCKIKRDENAALGGKQSFQFMLQTNGMRVFEADYGYYLAENAQSDTRIEIGTPVVYDENLMGIAGTLTVSAVREAEDYLMTLTIENPLSANANWSDLEFDFIVRSADSRAYIEDTTIYSGKPDLATGTWQFDHAGYADSNYKVGRILVRLPGLYNSSLYQSLSADSITNVTYHADEATGTPSETIMAYAFNGNTWSENTATWNNTSGNSYTTYLSTATPAYNETAHFNITALVKGWKSGTYNPYKGFMLKNINETDPARKKGFNSSNYTNTNLLPFVTMQYTESIRIIQPAMSSVNEGTVFSLQAQTSPAGKAVTWGTYSSNYASISSSGVVSANKAGRASFYACFNKPDGTVAIDFCTIYITLCNGVYYIKNDNSSLYMNVRNSAIAELSPTEQRSKYTGTDLEQKLPQLWKVFYLGEGKYSLRPMHKPNMALQVTGDLTAIASEGSDTLTGVNAAGQWEIYYANADTYMIKTGSGFQYLYVSGNSTTSSAGIAVGGAGTESQLSCRWAFELLQQAPQGALIYNHDIRYFGLGDVIQFDHAIYSPHFILQTAVWESSAPRVAEVSAEGVITAKAPGTATISVASYYDRSLSAEIDIQVTAAANGLYRIKNRETNKYVDILEKSYASGTQLHQWAGHLGATQVWKFELDRQSGYYTIQSLMTKLYMRVEGNSTASGAKIKQDAMSQGNGLFWRAVSTGGGAVKLIPKTGENNNPQKVASLVSNSSSNGVILEQRNYSDNDVYLDEWILEPVNLTMRLEVNYDKAFRNHSFYRNRYEIFENARDFYQERFGADILAYGYHQVESYPETTMSNGEMRCQQGNLARQACACGDNCTNEPPSEGAEYHHKNLSKMLHYMSNPDLNHTAKILLTGHYTCDIQDGAHLWEYDPNSGKPVTFGLTSKPYGKIIISGQHRAIVKMEQTVIHEIGHLYMAEDHNKGPLKPGQNDDCIYGANKGTPDVVENLMLCDYCKNTINSNIRRFSH